MVVVDTMLEMAGVRASDFLIDLGSGDGRIVIEAAKKHHARGIGVDYDPRLVKLANDNAREAGVADRVKFVEQDIFKTDLGPASVVTMYLLPEYNLALKPRLLALKPGTRIVSHDWHMGDWQPDAEKTVPVPDKKVGVNKESTIYYWIVPARVDGRWRSRVPTAGGVADVEFDFRQAYQQFEGTARSGGKEFPMERTFLKANYISFRVDTGKETLRFQGYVRSGRIVADYIQTKPGLAIRKRTVQSEPFVCAIRVRGTAVQPAVVASGAISCTQFLAAHMGQVKHGDFPSRCFRQGPSHKCTSARLPVLFASRGQVVQAYRWK